MKVKNGTIIGDYSRHGVGTIADRVNAYDSLLTEISNYMYDRSRKYAGIPTSAAEEKQIKRGWYVSAGELNKKEAG